MHREFGRERGWRWRLGRDLAVSAVLLAVMSALFILGDLAIYGRVNW
jgi:hypothetical protein